MKLFGFQVQYLIVDLQKIGIFYINLVNFVQAEEHYFAEGKKLFNSKKYEDAKFKFEKDIVFNPKNENSYLYLAKIFKQEKKVDLEEKKFTDLIELKTTLEGPHQLREWNEDIASVRKH